MRVTATKLRQNVYAILDEVLEKGIPVEIERKGRILKIVPAKKVSIFDRIPPAPDLIMGDPKDLMNFKLDWEKEWREPENLDAVAREFEARKRRAKKKRK